MIDNNKNKVKPSVKEHHVVNLSNSDPTYIGFTPQMLRNIYNIPSLPASNNNSTITIVTMFSYSKLQEDFNGFCKKFKLPLKKLNIHTMPNAIESNNWIVESCIDVQMAYVFNPYAEIIVVESTTDSCSDLKKAISYAINNEINGLETQIISMSWGVTEFDDQVYYDDVFRDTSVCFCAASGDETVVNWPATNPNVVAVGGTTLTILNNGRVSETPWIHTGRGESVIYSEPDYQHNLTKTDYRIIPDVSMVGNPSTGVSIWCQNELRIMGGTSVACPLFCGMLSLINQIRMSKNKSILSSDMIFNFFYSKENYNDDTQKRVNYYAIMSDYHDNNDDLPGYKFTEKGPSNCKKFINTIVNL